MDRRSFLTSLAAVAPASAVTAAPRKRPGPICFFSKHLAGLGPREMARKLKAVGYGGIELTVRPGGHVLPEHAATELPRAVAEIRAEGLEVPVIATAIKAPDEPHAAALLGAAAKAGVRFFRPGWFDYALVDVKKELQAAGQSLARLTTAAKRAGIELAYMNHVGNVGFPVWDLARMVEPLDPRWAGVYYDIRHAVAAGGAGSWKFGAHLVAPRVKVFSVKDFYWSPPDPPVNGRRLNGSWTMVDCPLGHGMVDVKAPLDILSRTGFAGPITVYLEYLPKGTPDEVVAAAARDLVYLQAGVNQAYG